MNIRQAELTDLEGCLPLFEEFKAESLAEYGMDLDLETIRATCQQYIGTSLVATEDGKIVGILAGTIIRVPTCSAPIYMEHVWYVLKAHRRLGLHLMKAAQEHALKAGCGHMIMAHMLNSKPNALADFYVRQGFVPCEIHYIKKLQGETNATPA